MAQTEREVNTPGTNGHAPGGLNGHAPVAGDAVPVVLNGAGGAKVPMQNPNATAETRLKVIKFSHVSKRFVLHTARPKSFQDMLVGLMGRAKLTRPPPGLAPQREFWALKDVNFSIYEG